MTLRIFDVFCAYIYLGLGIAPLVSPLTTLTGLSQTYIISPLVDDLLTEDKAKNSE